MATVTVTYAPVAPTPPPEKTGVTLEVSYEEAQFLATLVGHSFGSKHGNSIYGALYKAQVSILPYYHGLQIDCKAYEKRARGGC